ncbi:MAG TPA: shikimate dehydrogenase, partial [Luteolibacter sp.]|nr:shikimate dehydrogenase [Luteolibacter sp.]
EEFRPAMDRLRVLGFIGCNVTVPHKFAALAACDTLDPEAEALGAVNTIRFTPDGLHGYNTDGPGFCNAVRDCFGGVLSGLTVAIVGAGGGAGQAIATQCVLSGAAKLVLINRTRSKLDALLKHLAEFNRDTEIHALGLDDARLADECRACHLLVNTSSVGLKEGDPSILPATCLREGQWVYDTIYQPPVTPLLALAGRSGCHTANGLSMLIHQGALSFQHWFPATEPLPHMRKALA